MKDTGNSINKSSRRTFLKSSGAAAAGLALTAQTASAKKTLAANSRTEALALNGGSKTVTFPDDQLSAATKWPRFGEEEKQAVWEVLDLSCGEVYRDLPLLEEEWREYHNVPFSKAHNNGTSTLTSMFFALDLPPGSEILVPSYTFFATIVPMRFFGYVPIFVDLNPKTACFDLEYAAKHMTKNTKAMVPMHSWGLPCDMDEICDFAKEHGLIVCEDAAHAHGASLKGKKMGAWGDYCDIQSTSDQATSSHRRRLWGNYQTREYYRAGGRHSAITKFPPKFDQG